MINAVIFDMDGLMLDTERLSMRAWMAAAVQVGHPLTEEVCRGMIGLGQMEVSAYLTSHLEDEAMAGRLKDAAQAHYEAAIERDGVPCKEGLGELLEFLGRKGIPKAVATSTPTARAADKLRRVGVLSAFDAIVGGDRVTRGKPSPDIFLLAARELAQPPARCLALEDSGPGIRGAVAAGMRVIFVPDICDVADDTRRRTFATAPSLSEARTIIERLVP